jgi:hypothetical protein
MSTLRHYLARYACLVLAGMNTKAPVGWTWPDGTNTDPTPLRHSGPTDVAPGSDAAPTPARRGTTT